MDGLGALETLLQIARSPRAFVRDLAGSFAAIAVALVVAIVAIPVFSILALVIMIPVGVLLDAAGLGALGGTALLVVIVGGTVVPSVLVTVAAYRRVARRAPVARPANQDRSAPEGLVLGVARVVGFGLGIGFVYVDGALVGDGPLWLAELPLILGAVTAMAIAVRVRSKPIASAAEAFFAACALFALLFLGAG